MLPLWSRLRRRNANGVRRSSAVAKHRAYNIEIANELWSLWGNLHPSAPVFPNSQRGHQILACCVLACCASCLYQLDDWNAQLLDSIVVSGDAYYAASIALIKQRDYEFSLENLLTECTLCALKFRVHLEHVVYGRVCGSRMNLADALVYFFSQHQLGIIQLRGYALAIGFIPQYESGGFFFMYDCEAQGTPLFVRSQGTSYILRMRRLQQLLYCILVTLRKRCRNASFSIHKVDVLNKKNNIKGHS
ncbi:uncharacterized protein LOC115623186 isoform X2 [Scaptodrosophila lebanonensis]|uniref:Uncharacterized protein LOC115623186 isoform X2 n=1 Tax=Drosophila lebanonensis TaxID=7225 RepID=A0A6J2TB58_DROLE|nr:uncharacterized protein LOC115623186 isoform X2 [Scaptodrosophila lebanonensis]